MIICQAALLKSMADCVCKLNKLYCLLSMSDTSPNHLQTDARQRLYTALAGIPAGYVISYGQLAALAGFPRRARWAGQVLKHLPADTRLPWHRVVNAQGKISLPPGPAAERQKALLEAEGVMVSDSLRINLRQYAWIPPLSDG